MKKTVLILVGFIMMCIHAMSQDIIVMNDKTEIKSKVVEIGDSEIKYKKFENLDGPVYAAKKTGVFMIIYANGQRETFAINTSPAIITPSNNVHQENKKDTVRQLRLLKNHDVEEHWYKNDKIKIVYSEGNGSTTRIKGTVTDIQDGYVFIDGAKYDINRIVGIPRGTVGGAITGYAVMGGLWYFLAPSTIVICPVVIVADALIFRHPAKTKAGSKYHLETI
jgi:hypothetical protein